MNESFSHTTSHATAWPDMVQSAAGALTGMDGAGGWPVQERLSAFFFMLLDALEGAGVHASTFNREASACASDFHVALREQLVDVLDAVDVPGVNRLVTDSAPSRFAVAEILVQLLSTSLADASDNRERSAALADKSLAWAAALIANPIPARTLDVVRYAMEAGYLRWKP